MAGRLTTALGIILAVVVVAGTALYIRGMAPPYPYNAWAFNGMVLLSLVLALLAGRAR